MTATRSVSSASNDFPAIVSGERIYAVGDIHGRLDLLDGVLDRIDAELIRHGQRTGRVVFIGDYVDRGPDSAGVLYRLIECATRYECIFLKGNHEQLLLRFLDDASLLPAWLTVGGQATLQSYGIPALMRPSPIQSSAVQSLLRQVMPQSHVDFLHACQTSHTVDDYMFVHAGINPERPLDSQRDEDLLWIREQFTGSGVRLEKFIIHGHTPVYEPDVQANRINIDTGAHATGKLTCLVLEANVAYFI